MGVMESTPKPVSGILFLHMTFSRRTLFPCSIGAWSSTLLDSSISICLASALRSHVCLFAEKSNSDKTNNSSLPLGRAINRSHKLMGDLAPGCMLFACSNARDTYPLTRVNQYECHVHSRLLLCLCFCVRDCLPCGLRKTASLPHLSGLDPLSDLGLVTSLDRRDRDTCSSAEANQTD